MICLGEFCADDGQFGLLQKAGDRNIGSVSLLDYFPTMKRGCPDHPKTLMLAARLEEIYRKHHARKRLGSPKALAIGILEALWHWCARYAIQGDIGKWPDEVIAQAVEWEFSPKELISSLIESGFLDIFEKPFRLVIHDIKDHAENGWRQNLENAGLTWWDGSSPRKYKLQKYSTKTPRFGVSLSQSQSQSLNPLDPLAVQPQNGKQFPLEDWVEILYSRHPKKKDKCLVGPALYKILEGAENPEATFQSIDRSHREHCRLGDWTKENGRYCPRLAEWLSDEGWKQEVESEADSPYITSKQYHEEREREKQAAITAK